MLVDPRADIRKLAIKRIEAKLAPPTAAIRRLVTPEIKFSDTDQRLYSISWDYRVERTALLCQPIPAAGGRRLWPHTWLAKLKRVA